MTFCIPPRTALHFARGLYRAIPLSSHWERRRYIRTGVPEPAMSQDRICGDFPLILQMLFL